MDKAIYLGFAIFEFSELLIYETYYDKLQPYFGEKYLHCRFMESVTKNTPIFLKEGEFIKILRVDDISSEETWYKNDNVITQWDDKYFADCNGIQVGTSDGWKNIKNIVRHKRENNIRRIRTKHCGVDVNEDHCSLNKDR